jgi:hypothetical protein
MRVGCSDAHSYTSEVYHGWPKDRKRSAWTTMFRGLLEAAMPLCRTAEERRFFQKAIFERIVVYPNYLCRAVDGSNLEKLTSECVERLKCEANTHVS